MNISDTVIQLLQRIAEREKLIHFNIDANTGDLKGEGFTSEILFASITSEFNEKIDIVVKQCVDNETSLQSVINRAMHNEIFFYDEINPLIQKFQESFGVYKPLLAVPKYYGNVIGKKEIILALENLKKRGFVLFDKKNLTDEIHTTSILKQYGRTHGVFFAYKAKYLQNFLHLKKKITWSMDFVVTNTTINNMFKTVFGEVVEQLENSDIRKDILDRLRKYENYQDILKEYVQYKGKYECILHGDGWTNNMMFRYSNTKEHKKLEEVYFLDWQTMNVGTPVFDLAYFIYSSASKDILDNLDQYLRIYYDSLSETVKMFGLDPKEVYPFCALREEWKIYAKVVFIIPFCGHKMRLTSREDIVRADEINNTGDDHVTQTLKKEVSDKQLLLKRIRDLVEHVYETGVL